MIDVDRRVFVEALEVERVDGAGLDQGGDQLVVPVVERVELEAQGRVDGEAGEQRLDRGALLAAEAGEAHRVDEVERPRLAAERGGEVGAGLAQRQVERRRLEGPAAVLAGDVALGRRGREEVDRVELLGELGEGAGDGEALGRAGILLGDVVDGVVDDVFADPLVAAAAQLDDRGQPFEVAEGDLEPLELAGLDLQRQVGDRVEGGHRPLSLASDPQRLQLAVAAAPHVTAVATLSAM